MPTSICIIQHIVSVINIIQTETAIILRRLARVEAVVLALLLEKLLMGSALDDPALLEHDNAVGVSDGRETVSDYKGRSALHQLIHALLNHSLRAGINGAGRLVENERRRISDRRARDGEHLALSLA